MPVSAVLASGLDSNSPDCVVLSLPNEAILGAVVASPLCAPFSVAFLGAPIYFVCVFCVLV